MSKNQGCSPEYSGLRCEGKTGNGANFRQNGSANKAGAAGARFV
jgi:hypothetical protein